MSIIISEQDTTLSFAYAVNYIHDTFAVNTDAEGNRTDGIFTYGAKVVGRILPHAILGILAAIETVVKAILTGISAILKPLTNRPYEYFRDSAKLAGRTTKEAFFGIFGHTKLDPYVLLEEAQMELEGIKTRLDQAQIKWDEAQTELEIAHEEAQTELEIAHEMVMKLKFFLAVLAVQIIGCAGHLYMSLSPNRV